MYLKIAEYLFASKMNDWGFVAESRKLTPKKSYLLLNKPKN